MTDTLNSNTITSAVYGQDNMISSYNGAVGSNYSIGFEYDPEDYKPLVGYDIDPSLFGAIGASGGFDFSGLHRVAGISDLNVDYHLRENEDLLGIKYKYDENNALGKIRDYINSTYGQHYVGNGDIQTVDFWESLGSLETTCRDTAIKYLARYGKKGGRNEKDLLKAVHYIILMMYAAPKENQVPKEFKP